VCVVLDKPDYINEMPIDGADSDRSMPFAVKIPEQRPDRKNEQHQHTDNDMGKMKAGDGEIKGTIRTGVELVGLPGPFE
jgi:hypothetical protein